jgi:hypothetical protein
MSEADLLKRSKLATSLADEEDRLRELQPTLAAIAGPHSYRAK